MGTEVNVSPARAALINSGSNADIVFFLQKLQKPLAIRLASSLISPLRYEVTMCVMLPHVRGECNNSKRSYCE